MSLRDEILELYRDMYRLTVRVRFYPYALLTQDIFDGFDIELFRIQGRLGQIESSVITSSERLYTFTEAELINEKFWFLIWVKKNGRIEYGFNYRLTPLINLNLMEVVDFLKLVVTGIKLAIRTKYTRWKVVVEHELIAGIRDSDKNLFVFRLREIWNGVVKVETPSAWGDYIVKDYQKGTKHRAIMFVRTLQLLADDVNWQWRNYNDAEKQRILAKRGGKPLVRWRTMDFDYQNSIKVTKVRDVGSRSVWNVDFSSVRNKSGDIMGIPSAFNEAELRTFAGIITKYGGTADVQAVV